jgi:hypothetical protein
MDGSGPDLWQLRDCVRHRLQEPVAITRLQRPRGIHHGLQFVIV